MEAPWFSDPGWMSTYFMSCPIVKTFKMIFLPSSGRICKIELINIKGLPIVFSGGRRK